MYAATQRFVTRLLDTSDARRELLGFVAVLSAAGDGEAGGFVVLPVRIEAPDPWSCRLPACVPVPYVVSVASHWEVVIKTQKGLLAISDLATWWRQATELTAARVLRSAPATSRPWQGFLRFTRIHSTERDDPLRDYPVQTIW
jgi:hypothetical protein